jgi:hypothetical protein
MSGFIGASLSAPTWTPAPTVSPATPGTPWTAGPAIALVVGPVYFLYGGA